MGDSRRLLGPQSLVRIEHVWAFQHSQALEPSRIGILLDYRGERPKFLAKLDLSVEVIPHLGSPRIGQNRARSKSPGSPFVPSVQDPDHLASGKPARHLIGDVCTPAVRNPINR